MAQKIPKIVKQIVRQSAQQISAKYYPKLNPTMLGLAAAILMSIAILFSAFWVLIGLGGAALIDIIALAYPGFSLTPLGIIIGLIWAFIDGFIAAWLLAYLYNKLL